MCYFKVIKNENGLFPDWNATTKTKIKFQKRRPYLERPQALSISNDLFVSRSFLTESEQRSGNEFPVFEDAPGPGRNGDESESVVAAKKDLAH
jgi:hypothetical protein